MTLEEYPALAEYRSLWADLDAWTATLHTMASELARGITVEVECPDCEGRGYVDYSYDTGSARALGGRMFTVGTPMRQNHFARITSSLRTDGLLTIDGGETLEIEHRAVASHSELVDGRVTAGSGPRTRLARSSSSSWRWWLGGRGIVCGAGGRSTTSRMPARW